MSIMTKVIHMTLFVASALRPVCKCMQLILLGSHTRSVCSFLKTLISGNQRRRLEGF